jgi:hypothetical protein
MVEVGPNPTNPQDLSNPPLTRTSRLKEDGTLDDFIQGGQPGELGDPIGDPNDPVDAGHGGGWEMTYEDGALDPNNFQMMIAGGAVAVYSHVTSGPYTQIQHPTNSSYWDYYGTEFTFSWKGKAYLLSSGVVPGGLTHVDFEYNGTVSVDPETGALTKTWTTKVGQDPKILKEGYLRTNRVDQGVPFSFKYQISMTGNEEKFSIIFKLWQPRQMQAGAAPGEWVDTAPDPTEDPLVNTPISDAFYYQEDSYDSP